MKILQYLTKFKRNKKVMKTLNIEIPEGFEIDKEKSTFERIVFKEKVDLTKEINDFLYSLMKETICKRNEDSSIITYYNKSDEWLIQQDFKNKYLYVSYNRLWKIFEEKYKLNYQQIKDLITPWLEKHLNCKELTIYGQRNAQ